MIKSVHRAGLAYFFYLRFCSHQVCEACNQWCGEALYNCLGQGSIQAQSTDLWKNPSNQLPQSQPSFSSAILSRYLCKVSSSLPLLFFRPPNEPLCRSWSSVLNQNSNTICWSLAQSLHFPAQIPSETSPSLSLHANLTHGKHSKRKNSVLTLGTTSRTNCCCLIPPRNAVIQ